MIFLRTESPERFVRAYPLTTALLALILGVYVVSRLLIPLGLEGPLYAWGAFDLSRFVHRQFWRPITAVFLHADFLHVLFNAFYLYLLSPPIEARVGKAGYLLFLLTADASTTLFLLVTSSPPVIGASGIVYGFLGLYLYYIWKRAMWIDAASRQVVLFLLLFGLVQSFIPGISFFGHVGGFLGGFFFGALYHGGKYYPFS
ncbi:rhomboid family intramembrane serine protease [Brockia lithotrophica]|uniref:Membrane associated rhomboid family serine protease n=1 Tax=Brockia lithotrophica TaxID=933949 RepID=A0A660KYB2_9BACL|nr:rhomboid family intramembrane serine protease [Brockia lithotrophica]RKQ85609.1 membrane associated rhomboid family serine protease [Brockia lithotrophica]